jgi:HSP20 family protein
MNKPALKLAIITILGVGAIGAVGAQSYYTHELAQRVAAQTDPVRTDTPPLATRGQWDPWIDLQRLQARIEHAFDQSFDAMQGTSPVEATRVTLEEHADNYVVKASIPGAQEGDIKVNLDGRLLSISSQTQGSEKQTGQNGAITHEESYSGAFEEAFTLPGPVNAAGMKSHFKDGVMTLTIPKAVS